MKALAPTLDSWEKTGLRFDHQGHSIFYRDQGEGPPLLCVHGFPTASWDWHRLWPELTRRYRVVALDMIGFGFSAKPRDYLYSILDQATIHEKLLGRLKIQRVHVLAHDYGDTVTQELLARYDERQRTGAAGPELASVCFLNGGLFPEVHRALLAQRLLLSPLGPLVARLMNERRFRATFPSIFAPATRPSEEDLHAFWTLIAYADGPRIAHKVIRYMVERRTHRKRWVGTLQSTNVPLRLIAGALDPVSGRHMAERYQELVPAADVVILDEVGHYPQLEAAGAVLNAYLEFRERLGAEDALCSSLA